jgi:hypothetical protein
MTKTYEEIKRENEVLKRKLAAEEAKRAEETIIGYMAGRVGKKYGMWATGEMMYEGGEF